MAAVVLFPAATVTPGQLMEWANSRVDAKFQRIRDVVIMESFPCNVAGKMLKRTMRDQYKEALRERKQ